MLISFITKTFSKFSLSDDHHSSSTQIQYINAVV